MTTRALTGLLAALFFAVLAVGCGGKGSTTAGQGAAVETRDVAGQRSAEEQRAADEQRAAEAKRAEDERRRQAEEKRRAEEEAARRAAEQPVVKPLPSPGVS